MQTYDPWKPQSKKNRPPSVVTPLISKAELLRQVRLQQYYAQQQQLPDTGDDYYEDEYDERNWVQKGIDAVKHFWLGFDGETQHALHVIGIILLYGIVGSAFVYWIISTSPPIP